MNWKKDPEIEAEPREQGGASEGADSKEAGGQWKEAGLRETGRSQEEGGGVRASGGRYPGVGACRCAPVCGPMAARGAGPGQCGRGQEGAG